MYELYEIIITAAVVVVNIGMFAALLWNFFGMLFLELRSILTPGASPNNAVAVAPSGLPTCTHDVTASSVSLPNVWGPSLPSDSGGVGPTKDEKSRKEEDGGVYPDTAAPSMQKQSNSQMKRGRRVVQDRSDPNSYKTKKKSKKKNTKKKEKGTKKESKARAPSPLDNSEGMVIPPPAVCTAAATAEPLVQAASHGGPPLSVDAESDSWGLASQYNTSHYNTVQQRVQQRQGQHTAAGRTILDTGAHSSAPLTDGSPTCAVAVHQSETAAEVSTPSPRQRHHHHHQSHPRGGGKEEEEEEEHEGHQDEHHQKEVTHHQEGGKRSRHHHHHQSHHHHNSHHDEGGEQRRRHKGGGHDTGGHASHVKESTGDNERHVKRSRRKGH